MNVGPNINVWTLGRGPRGQWKLQHTTNDFEEATALFAELDGQGQQVALYELGLFEHEGRQVAGQVGFWWSASLNGYMEMEPQGRGAGWADDFDTYVQYQPPDLEADETVAAPAKPWAAAQVNLPAIARSYEDPRASASDLSPVDAARMRRNQTLWKLFILPGKVALWVEYMFPDKGQVLASSRRFGNPLVEKMYAIVFWVVAFFLLAGLAGSGK